MIPTGQGNVYVNLTKIMAMHNQALRLGQYEYARRIIDNLYKALFENYTSLCERIAGLEKVVRQGPSSEVKTFSLDFVECLRGEAQTVARSMNLVMDLELREK